MAPSPPIFGWMPTGGDSDKGNGPAAGSLVLNALPSTHQVQLFCATGGVYTGALAGRSAAMAAGDAIASATAETLANRAERREAVTDPTRINSPPTNKTSLNPYDICMLWMARRA